MQFSQLRHCHLRPGRERLRSLNAQLIIILFNGLFHEIIQVYRFVFELFPWKDQLLQLGVKWSHLIKIDPEISTKSRFQTGPKQTN